MNKKIQNAITLRTNYINFIRTVKGIDKSITGSEFAHCISDINNSEFWFWKEWRKLANNFKLVRDTIPKNEENNKIPILLREIKPETIELLKITIIEVLFEILICDLSIDYIRVVDDGIKLHSKNNFDYFSNRYKIPNDIKNIISTEKYSIIDKDVIDSALIQVKDELLDDFKNSNYFDCNINSSQILIRSVELLD